MIDKRTLEKQQKKARLKLRKFNVELEELLDKYNYLMDVRLRVTQKGIVPQLVVDSPENLKGGLPMRQQNPARPTKMIKGSGDNRDVKEKKQEQRPVGKGKKGKR